MTYTLKTIIPLAFVFAFLVATNFLYAAWTAPTAAAPGDNAPAPINVGSATQQKNGDLGVFKLKSSDQVWAPEYCDALGNNCFAPGEVGALKVAYEVIGGGGGGGGDTGYGTAGTQSSISGGIDVTSAGGAGAPGRTNWGSDAGQASFYGPGGAGGRNSDSGNHASGASAPVNSYGAGGGGGGSHPFAAYNGGQGGRAALIQSGLESLPSGTELSITVGSGGSGGSGVTRGGAGANGYVQLTIGSQNYTYSSPGTYTFTITE